MSTAPPSTHTLLQRIVDDLGLQAFPLRGYRDETYLEAVLAAGYEVEELARAHDVSERTIHNALAAHDLERAQPPTRGPTRQLWEADASLLDDT